MTFSWKKILSFTGWLLLPSLACVLGMQMKSWTSENGYRMMISWMYFWSIAYLAFEPMFLRFYNILSALYVSILPYPLKLALASLLLCGLETILTTYGWPDNPTLCYNIISSIFWIGLCGWLVYFWQKIYFSDPIQVQTTASPNNRLTIDSKDSKEGDRTVSSTTESRIQEENQTILEDLANLRAGEHTTLTQYLEANHLVMSIDPDNGKLSVYRTRKTNCVSFLFLMLFPCLYATYEIVKEINPKAQQWISIPNENLYSMVVVSAVLCLMIIQIRWFFQNRQDKTTALCVLPMLSILFIYVATMYCRWLATSAYLFQENSTDAMMLVKNLAHLVITLIFQAFTEICVSHLAKPNLFARLVFFAQLTTFLPQYVLLQQMSFSYEFFIVLGLTSLHHLLMAAQVYSRFKNWVCSSSEQQQQHESFLLGPHGIHWIKTLEQSHHLRLCFQSYLAEIWSLLTLLVTYQVTQWIQERKAFPFVMDHDLIPKFIALIVIRSLTWIAAKLIIQYRTGHDLAQIRYMQTESIETEDMKTCVFIDYPHVFMCDDPTLESYYDKFMDFYPLAAFLLLLFASCPVSDSSLPLRYAWM
jgi:hypothetical protein